jgi:putative FmdB family regulatory protein
MLEDFMPIYAFQCQACGHSFEVMQKMSEPAPTVCVSCGKPELRKQLSAAGFQLKGSGWYVTDFKGGAKPNPAAPASPEAKPAPEAKKSPDQGGSDPGPKTGSGAA